MGNIALFEQIPHKIYALEASKPFKYFKPPKPLNWFHMSDFTKYPTDIESCLLSNNDVCRGII